MGNQKGFVPVLILVVVLAGFVLISSNIPLNRTYTQGAQNIQGANTDKAEIISDQGQEAVVSSGSGALSNFPLTIDPETNTLTVTTKTGVKNIVVLPDVAIKNLLTSKVLDDITSEKAKGKIASVATIVKLDEEEGELVYKIQGFRKHTFLGLNLLKTKVEAFVSAESGQVIKTTQSLWGRILNKIAP